MIFCTLGYSNGFKWAELILSEVLWGLTGSLIWLLDSPAITLADNNALGSIRKTCSKSPVTISLLLFFRFSSTCVCQFLKRSIFFVIVFITHLVFHEENEVFVIIKIWCDMISFHHPFDDLVSCLVTCCVEWLLVIVTVLIVELRPGPDDTAAIRWGWTASADLSASSQRWRRPPRSGPCGSCRAVSPAARPPPGVRILPVAHTTRPVPAPIPADVSLYPSSAHCMLPTD